MARSRMEMRLRREVTGFATGYPEAWRINIEAGERPLDHLLQALIEKFQHDIIYTQIAQRLGTRLRQKYNYITSRDIDEASADYRRGLAWVAIDVLHGADCTTLMAGDKLTAEQAAFYFADDWWMGRDDKPIEQWSDIRRVREQLLIDALNMPNNDRGNLLDFCSSFMQRHPELMCNAKFGLQTVGFLEGFTDQIWADTGDNDLLRGVYFFAEVMATDLSWPPAAL